MRPILSRRGLSVPAIQAFLSSQSALGFTYPNVGATAGVPPARYNVDHSRIRLGEGEGVFRASRAALESWAHFDLGWLEAKSFEPSIKVGGMVAVVGRSLGLWWLHACRVVYVIEEEDDANARFGFAYGTLPAHAESGEERFLIEWDKREGSVWYDLLAFSKPNGLLAGMGYPWLRILQRRFVRDSQAAMIRAVR
ncbi:MAG TPA: DUF1990 domain-containing protein [Tepidisphaeraceae bacterium]|jgi:uncharacterized protein (UPF0548 family)